MQDKEDVPIQSEKEVDLGLGISSLHEVPVISIWTTPTKEDDTTLDLLEFHSLLSKSTKKDDRNRPSLGHEHQV
jgi:hypothetical protein